MNSVFVTGANRGIGLEFVRQLARRKPQPSHVFASCRNPREAKELKALAASNDNVHIVELDVQNEATYQPAVETVSNLVGEKGLNVLINNAGIYSTKSYEDVSRELLTAIMDINVISPMRITQAFLPLLRQASKRSTMKQLSFEQAAIINISSGYGSIAESTGGHAGYRESKAALNMFTKSLSLGLKKDGILVTSLCPGWVQTDMGGPYASRTPQDSVSSLLKICSQLSDKENGLFLSNRLPISVNKF
ncbi:C-signal-like [Diadema setosum]|uniref:C-signal-like n=1 Tax=Diadema setosum TaxID=31175 RepID=UPI003B3AAED6